MKNTRHVLFVFSLGLLLGFSPSIRAETTQSHIIYEDKVITQKKGQTFPDFLNRAQISAKQKKLIYSLPLLHAVKSERQYRLRYAIDKQGRQLKTIEVTRNRHMIHFAITDVGGQYQFQKNTPKAHTTAIASATKTQQNPITPQQTSPQFVKIAPKKNSAPTTVFRRLGDYRFVSVLQKRGQSLDATIKNIGLTKRQRQLVMTMPALLVAKTNRHIHLMFEKEEYKTHLKAIRIVRGARTAEYVLVKYRGLWRWANKKGQIEIGIPFSRYPLKFSRVSSPFNLHRRHPVTGKIHPHKGVDLVAPYGAAIYAPSNGVVVFAGRQRGYGNVLEINHQGGYQTRYAHLSKFMPSARKGQRIRKGQLVARVGNSGLSTGTHLHYEIRINGIAKNPQTVRLPKGKKKELETAKAAVNRYLPILRQLS